jgi:Tfp pilus assembly protein PilV
MRLSACSSSLINRIKFSYGFTLLEVFIVSAIAITLVSILAASLVQFRSIFQTGDVSVALQQESRLATYNIAANLRQTADSQKTITANSPVSGTDSILYHVPLDADLDGLPDISPDVLQWDPTDITIALDPTTAQIIKNTNSVSTILGRNVKRVNFFDHARDASLNLGELKIVLELEKSGQDGRLYSYLSTSILDMRN